MRANAIRLDETKPSAGVNGFGLLRHVSVVTVQVASPAGSTIQLLVLPDSGICMEFYHFCRAPKYRGRSGSWRRTHALAVALLYDYMLASVAAGGPGSQPTAEIMADFGERLAHGTIQTDGDDPSGLFWPARSQSRAYALLLAARTFGKYLRDQLGLDAHRFGWTEAVPTLSDWVARQAQADNSSPGNVDGQEATSGKIDRVAEPLPFRRLLSGASRSGRPMPFPTWLEWRFLEALMPDGAPSPERRGIAIRNVLVFLLLMFGGLRKSEPLHLFLQDVELDPDGQVTAVFLYHPETGRVPGTTQTRAEYLRRSYGMVPRVRHDISDSRWAGWKSVLLDEAAPDGGLRSRVYWRNREAGALFWDLHTVYVREVRPRDATHPYYFVNLNGPSYGAPMTREAVDNAFATTLARLDLLPNASAGLSLHGLRHGYGQALVNAGLRPVIIQLCLHHVRLSSQQVYTRPFPSDVNHELARAEQRIAGDAIKLPLEGIGTRFKSDPKGLFKAVRPAVTDGDVSRVERLNDLRENGRTEHVVGR